MITAARTRDPGSFGPGDHPAGKEVPAGPGAVHGKVPFTRQAGPIELETVRIG